MNCEQFQSRLMEEPCCEDRDFIAHRESCAHCAREWQQAREFEQMLQAAISVQPENELRAKQPLGRPAQRRRQIWLKAVSVLLLVGVTVAGFNLAQQMFAGDNLPQLVVRHIQKEPEMLNSRQAMNRMELLEALSPLGFELVELPAEVTAAIPCWIRKRRGMHLVMQGGDGPVTVLLMPGEYAQQKQAVVAVSLSGFLIPTDWGSMAVVSHAGEDIEALVHFLRRRVRWKGRQSSVASF
ncbi:DUF3379 family protein [Thiolapillus sp.]